MHSPAGSPMAKTLFPHQKLEWNIKRLKEELESKGT
jgi:hypothetical protein